ncbi:MAG: DUF3999 family protein [Acidobacteriaceae bacterium]|nr:DUF3999 family protein [Acidobacteriaceae bacterium]
MMKLALSLLAVSCSLRADFDVQRWQFRRPIEVKETAAVAAFAVYASVYRDSRARLRDLRIIRAGSETPYQLRTMSGSHEEVELRPTLLNKAVVPQIGLQAVLDLNGHVQHNRLRLVTGQKNFKEAVRVETSDDRRNWALLRNDGLIFDISREDRDVSDLTVEYPVSTRRYLRLTIPGWNDPAYLKSAWLLYRKEVHAVRDVMATLTPVLTEGSKAGTSSVLFDLGFEDLPYDRLDISTGPGVFSRDVEVFVSNDRNNWFLAGGGVLLRTAERTQLSIQVQEQWSRYIKLNIFNGDDAPLPVQGVTLQGFRRTVQFPATAPGPYWLYLGNAAAKEPSYDFARLTPAVSNAKAVSLGRSESNQQYQAPAMPWTDRYPYLLYAVLIGAVAVMGYITWRFLTKLKTA